MCCFCGADCVVCCFCVVDCDVCFFCGVDGDVCCCCGVDGGVYCCGVDGGAFVLSASWMLPLMLLSSVMKAPFVVVMMKMRMPML